MHDLTVVRTEIARKTDRSTVSSLAAPRLLWAAPAPARMLASSTAAALLSFSLTWMFVAL